MLLFHFMSAGECTFEMGLDTNGINALKTSRKAAPPVMLFADAPNESLKVDGEAELGTGGRASLPFRPPRHNFYILLSSFSRAGHGSRRRAVGNTITFSPNVGESCLPLGPFHCTLLLWHISMLRRNSKLLRSCCAERSP